MEQRKENDGEKYQATFFSDMSKQAGEVLLTLFPLWFTFIFNCYLVSATGNTFFIAQVNYLDDNTKQSHRLPEGMFYLATKFVDFLASQVCSCLIKMLCGNEREKQWARLSRIGVGMVFSILCCIIATLIEVRRKDNSNRSISVFRLVPQSFLSGLMRGIANEGRRNSSLTFYLNPSNFIKKQYVNVQKV